MKTVQFFLLGFLSFNALGASPITLSSFEKYKDNFQLLSADLVKLEGEIKKNPNPLFDRMFKDMSYMKEKYDHIAHPLVLDDLYQDAVDNAWPNLQKMTKALIPICEAPESFNIALCKNALEEMKTFAMNSKLSSENKDGITSFIDDYIAQVQAFYVINKDFIQAFNKNAEAITAHTIVPKKEIMPEAATPPSTKDESFSSIYEDPALLKVIQDFQGSATLYLGVFGALIAFMFGAQTYKKKRAQKSIKEFYSKLFTLSKKANIELKVFGKLSPHEITGIRNIHVPFLNTVYLSRAVAPKGEVRFKSKKQDIAVEVNYFTSRSIQTVMGLSKEKAFKESIEKLQSQVEEAGGEMVLSNRFNAFGEIIQSAMVIHLPKA